jgi:eukaryotic-like serine/threonine-protein kinase
MALSPGTKLGPYEIVTPLGAGGMGEVYRARDTRLDRIVAVKILPSHLSGNPEARRRFEREARAISGLNHPNICTLFDVGYQDGTDFLVMELLEGDTLHDRLLKGPLSADALLKSGQEICAGLERAHRSGVVHRDLKPSNIMLTKTGVKLMDFGLAKSTLSPASSALGATASLNVPAGNQPLTAEGTLVGTFQYMSPEQVEGREADVRSDIFALGAVLYEMATGKRAFEGKTTASVIAAVMASEPQPISAIQPLSPPALDRVIKTCLAKDPDLRFQDVHDVDLQLAWIAEGGSQAGLPSPVTLRRKNRERIAWAVAAVGLVVAVALALVHFRDSPPEIHVVRAFIQPPDNGSFFVLGTVGSPMLSPDGRKLAFIGIVAGVRQVWVRDLDSFVSRALPGTDYAYGAFWSPDGRNIAFFSQDKLKRVAVTGGPVITICEADGRGGSWNRQDVVIFAKFPGEVFQVPASGGDPQAVTHLDLSRNHKTHRWPVFLPDGNRFLYMASPSGLASDENVIKVGSLDGTTDQILFHGSSPVAYDKGYLLFMVHEKLLVRRFDPEKLEFLGDPVAVADDVVYDPKFSNGVFSAESGVLVFQSGNALGLHKIEMLDADGKVLKSLGDLGKFFDLRISPEGKRVAYSLIDRTSGKDDVWIQDIATGIRTRITTDLRGSRAPLWSHDGSRIAYTSVRTSSNLTVYSMPATGMGEEKKLFTAGESRAGLGYLTDWTPDSKGLIGEDHTSTGKVRISMGLLNGKDEAVPVLETPGANLYSTRLTADGHWIAYVSDETGKREVYVSRFPRPAGRLQVSAKGGRFPLWRGDGKELYYLDPENNVIGAELHTTNDSLGVTRLRTLFQLKSLGADWSWDVFPDGKRFLVTIPDSDVAPPLSLVLNWTVDLKK